MSRKKTQAPESAVADAGVETARNDTFIEVREIMPGSMRTNGGRKQRHPYTSILITDYLGGKVVASHHVTIDGPARVALGIIQTIARRNLDLTNEQLEMAKRPQGVML